MKTVKVFISSTFKDMNAERDVLVKDVFPKLREWAEETRGVLVQEVDLRWGVTEEQAQRGQVLDLCLEGIDECKPYFLCLLGKRYGWVPSPSHIRKDVFKTFLTAGSPLNEDEKQLIQFAYSGFANERVVSLNLQVTDSNREYIEASLIKAGIRTCDDKINLDNLKGLVQQALEKAGLFDASISITEQEIRHVLGENQIPWVIRDLDKIEAYRQLPQSDKDMISDFYVRGGGEPDWYLQPGCSDEDMKKLSLILCRMGLMRGYYNFFLLREDIGENHRDYIETDETANNKLLSLKSYILNAYKKNDEKKPVAVEEYPCSWEPEAEYPVTDLEVFGKRVYELLKNHMQSNPELKQDEELNDFSEERRLHMRFADMRTYNFRGRAQILAQLEKSICDALSGKLQTNGRTTRYIMVSGEPGSGKSALMAKLYLNVAGRENAELSDALLLPWFVGASKRSAVVTNMLMDFCAILVKEFNISDEIPGDPAELIKVFAKLLNHTDRKIIILIDAVNQLRDGTQNGRVYWLPDELPDNVCVMFSLVEDLRDRDGRFDIEADKSFLEAMRKRRIPPNEIRVSKLSDEERKDIIRSYLRQYNKTMSKEQELQIADKKEAYNPLFLQVALEELRMFSQFYELPGFIANGIRQTAEEMFEQMIMRVERDMERLHDTKGAQLFRRFMTFIAVGRHGMSEEDLRLLLGDWRKIEQNAGNEEKQRQLDALRLPDLIWEELRRSVRAYLFLSGDYWNFHHWQLGQAVFLKFLNSEEKLREAHSEVADFYSAIGYQRLAVKNDIHALEELPYHLSMAKRTDEIERLLSDMTFLDARLAFGGVYSLLEDYRYAKCEKDTPLERFRYFIFKNAEALRKNDNLFFSLAYFEGFKEARLLAGPAGYRGSWIKPWIRTEPIHMRFDREPKPEGETVSLEGVVNYPKSCAVDFAASRGLAFHVIKVGQIGMIDMEKMLTLDDRIATRPLRPLEVFVSDDAQYLAIAYENGEADVKKLEYDKEGNYLYCSHIAKISYLLPEFEAPVMIWDRSSLWYQQDNVLIRADFSGEGYTEKTIDIPTEFCGELSGAAVCGDRHVFTLRKKNASALISVDQYGIAVGVQRYNSDVCSVCSDAHRVAIAYGDRTICIYNSEDGFSLLRQSGDMGSNIDAFLFMEDRLLGITSQNAVFSWRFMDTNNIVFLNAENGLYEHTFQTRKIVSIGGGLIQCISKSNVFNFRIVYGETRQQYSLSHVFQSSGMGYTAVLRETDVFHLLGGFEFSPLFISDKENMLIHFAQDGKANILATSTYKLGYIIRPDKRTVTEIDEIPFALTSAAGCVNGGFWISEVNGNIHYVDEDGGIKMAVDMGGEYLTGTSLQSWAGLLIQRSVKHHSGKYGTDADMQLVFYTYSTEQSIKKIGGRVLYKDDGFLHDIAYAPVSKTLYLVMSMQGEENIYIRYGTVEDIVNKTEKRVQLPFKFEDNAKAVYSAIDNRLYILNKAGILFAVDTISFKLLATLYASRPFTDLMADPFTDSPATLISDKKEPYVLEPMV